MCLQLFAVPLVAGKVSPNRLSQIAGLRVWKLNDPIKGALHFSREPGCSCSLLSDHADFNAPVWALDPTVLEGLASALRALEEEADGFSFQALWIGEKPESESNVAIDVLLADVRNNRVRNKHLYVVQRPG